jgi:hypothetical protein
MAKLRYLAFMIVLEWKLLSTVDLETFNLTVAELLTYEKYGIDYGLADNRKFISSNYLLVAVLLPRVSGVCLG